MGAGAPIYRNGKYLLITGRERVDVLPGARAKAEVVDADPALVVTLLL